MAICVGERQWLADGNLFRWFLAKNWLFWVDFEAKCEHFMNRM